MNPVCTARPHGVFRNGFDLVTGTGEVLAVFTGSAWSERGTITAGGATYTFVRRGFGLALVSGDQELASARRRGWFSSAWDVAYDGRAGALERRGFWTPRYELVDATGGALGGIAQDHVFGRSMSVDLPDGISAASRAFLAAVVLTLANRARASSS